MRLSRWIPIALLAGCMTDVRLLVPPMADQSFPMTPEAAKWVNARVVQAPFDAVSECKYWLLVEAHTSRWDSWRAHPELGGPPSAEPYGYSPPGAAPYVSAARKAWCAVGARSQCDQAEKDEWAAVSQADTWDSYAPFFLLRWSHQKILGEKELLGCHFNPMGHVNQANRRVCQLILGEIAKSKRVRVFCPRNEQCQILRAMGAELERSKIEVVPTVARDPSCMNGDGVFVKASHHTFAGAYDTSDGNTEKCDYYWTSSGQINLCLTWGEGSQAHRTDIALVTTGTEFELRRDLPPDAQGAIGGDCHPGFPKTLDTKMAQWLAKEFEHLVGSPTEIGRVCALLNPDLDDPL
jgi:hypothetical protein